MGGRDKNSSGERLRELSHLESGRFSALIAASTMAGDKEEDSDNGEDNKEDEKRSELGLLETLVDDGGTGVGAVIEEVELAEGVEDEVDEEERTSGETRGAGEEEDKEKGEDDEGFIEIGGGVGSAKEGSERIGAGIGDGPGQVRGRAQDFAVGNVAESTDGLAKGGKENGGVSEEEEAETEAPGGNEEDDEDGKDGAKESHTALPDGEEVLGVGEVKVGVTLSDVVEASAQKADEDGPESYGLGGGGGDAVLLEVSASEQEAEEESEDISNAVIADGERTEMKERRIGVGDDKEKGGEH